MNTCGLCGPEAEVCQQPGGLHVNASILCAEGQQGLTLDDNQRRADSDNGMVLNSRLPVLRRCRSLAAESRARARGFIECE